MTSRTSIVIHVFSQLIRLSTRALHVSGCAVCHGHAHALVCESCIDHLSASRLRCLRCARAMVGSGLTHVNTCGACLREPPAMSLTLAAVDYGYPWDHLLARLKFADGSTRMLSALSFADPSIARVLATIMLRSDEIGQLLSLADVIVPMPLHPQRQMARGFNQSLVLAQALVRQHCAGQLLRSRLLRDVLLRVRHTPAQVGLSGAERRQNLRHAFAIDPNKAHVIRLASVVLIDDVITTGASMSYAAQALLQAGAASVSAIAFARTPDGPPG